ncbi:MAG: Fe-S cluster assembly protein SufD [candidate division Zixibacteria bacterium]|nr:Fe-S cluster assembly protein SufD [candidate division Zixibacteria bacterium]
MNDKFDNNGLISDLSNVLKQGPEWLLEKRRVSRDSFNNSPLPPRGLHLWRYTDPQKFINVSSTATDSATVGKQPSQINSDLSESDIPKGVIISSLSDAVENHRDIVEPHLYQLINSDTGKFEAQNGALWDNGLFIFVPSGVTINKPLHFQHVSSNAGSNNYPRLLIVVGDNAELSVIDEHLGAENNSDAPYYSNGAVEIFGYENSSVRYANLQEHSAKVHTFFTHRARLGRGANMLTATMSLGGLLSKQNYGVILDGDGAESNMYGLAFGSGHQHLDCHTLQHHRSSQTNSNIDFKVVLRDRAESAYTGLIRIEKEARNCEAYQINRNLLLNKGARAETIPELEILNEDVRCSHGATTGQIDPMERFYLEARGIDPSEAVRIIVAGFAESTLRHIPAEFRQGLQDAVAQKLKAM